MARPPFRRFTNGVLVALAALLAVPPAPASADDTNAVQRFAALTVTQAENEALAHSPDVAVARAAVDSAAGSLAQAQGVNGFSALVGYVTQPQGSGNPAVPWQQRLGTYQLQTTLGDVQGYAPLVAQARAALAQSLADEVTAERTERLKVVALYFGAVQSRVLRHAKEDAAQSADAFEEDVRARYGAGKLQRIDLLRAQVATAKARADLANARGTDLNATDALARELARPVSDLATLADDVPPNATVVDPDVAIARALQFRPEVRSADASVAQAQAARNAALRSGIPPVTLTGGYEHGDDGATIVGGPIFTASVVIPLSGVAAARVHVQDAAIRAAVAHREAVRRALALEVGSAARTAAAAVIAHDETQTARQLAQSELDAASAEYRIVPSSGISVKIARDIRDQAIVDDIGALYAEVQAQATLDVELTP
jgi:outer membrane protein TolC